MNNFFIKKYSLIRDHNSFFKKIKYYAAQRYMIRVLANIFVPTWFVLTNLLFSKKLSKNKRDREIIVSLTTFPARINRIWIVVECMLRQTYPPDRIILWLSKEQFDGFSSLPKRLLKLQKRGLQIEFCDEDLRSHKKYFYALKEYPNDIIINIDDDAFYPSNTISDLMDVHYRFPGAVCCNRASKIKIKEGELLSYKDWDFISGQFGPGFDVFPTGCGGILYPPGVLFGDVLNKEVFMKYCKHADDIWLYFMAQLNDSKLVKTNADDVFLIPIINRNDVKLSSINVDNGLNDEQLNNVRNYYIENKGIDPLKNILSV